MSEQEFHGSMTLADGSRVSLTSEQAKAMLAAARKRERKRNRAMPTVFHALSMMVDAKERLRALGWRDAVYCPKDGSSFAVCEIGSTGMWRAFYSGQWPDGHVMYGDCVAHPKGMYFKPLDQLSDLEATRMEECDRDHAAWVDRIGRSFAHD